MRQMIIAGNWKMNGSKESTAKLLDALKTGLHDFKDAQTIVFPPFVYLDQVASTLADTNIAWGTQTLDVHEPGAYTGETAASMLIDFGCRYVLVGHSERRALYGESNELVAQKFAQAQYHQLIPILCVGETEEQRKDNLTETVIIQQLEPVLNLEGGVGVFGNAVIAYEPVWAIGTGLTATPEQAQEVHQFIRTKLAEHDPSIAENVSLLYGGSMKAANAQSLLSMPDIDGGLIGGAALNANEFIEIAQCTR